MYYELFAANVKKIKPGSKPGEFIAICPFHDDKNPSLSIDADKGLYYCHACQAKGNHITFLKELGLPLPEKEKKDRHAGPVSQEVIDTLKNKFGKTLSLKVINHFRLFQSFYTRTDGERINYIGLGTQDGFNERLEYEKPDDKGKIRWKLPKKDKNEKVGKGSYIGRFRSAETVFLCEGEWDCFTLVDRGIDNAISFTNGAKLIPPQHLEAFTGKTVFICYDFDEAGMNGAKIVAEALYAYASSIRIVKWENTGLVKNSADLKDLSDYFQKLSKSEDDFKRLVDEAPLYKRTLDRETLIQTVEAFSELKEISKYVLGVLNSFGYFVKAKASKNLYWFSDGDKSLYTLDKKDKKLGYFINHHFEINPESADYKSIVMDLETHAYHEGQEKEIYNFAHYEEKTNQLYIYNNAKIIYKVTENSIDECSNGDDGMLFTENESLEPFLVDRDKKPEDSLLSKYLFNVINFDYDPKTHPLTQLEQRLLFKYYFYALFFASLQKTKPLLILSGTQGSGKSMIMKLLLLLFLGKNKSVKSLPDDERELQITIKNNYFLYFDNVDERIQPKIKELIASASTSYEVAIRKLYTDSDQITFIPVCFLGFGTRTTVLNRQDLADRSLIFTVKRLSDNERRTDAFLEDGITANKNQMWTEIFHELQGMVRKLKTYTKDSQAGHKLRIADFCNLAVQLANQDERTVLERTFSKMSISQSMFSLTDDIFYNVMDNLAASHNGEVILSLDRDAFYEIFRTAASDMGFDVEKRRLKGAGFPTASGFTKYLKKKSDLYEKAFVHFQISEERVPRICVYHTTGEKEESKASFLAAFGLRSDLNSLEGKLPGIGTMAKPPAPAIALFNDDDPFTEEEREEKEIERTLVN